MSDLRSLCTEKIHRRDIAISTYEAPERSIVVEGILTDDRLRPTHTMAGGSRPAGRIHHMIVRIHVEGPPLIIAAVEAEMPEAPLAECLRTREMLAPVAGMKLSAGFTAAVKARIGGANGCAHLTALLLAMAPAAVQGFWTMAAARPIAPDERRGILQHFLADTCYVWRRDGEQLRTLTTETTIGPRGAGRP